LISICILSIFFLINALTQATASSLSEYYRLQKTDPSAARNALETLSRRDGLSAWNLGRSSASNDWFHVNEAGERSRQSEVKTM
jgi:hypothetical protein